MKIKDSICVFGLGEEQLPGIKILSKHFKVIGFDIKKKTISKKYCYKIYNTFNKHKILKICKFRKIKHLFSFCTDFPLTTIGWLNEKLSLKGIKYKAAKLGSDKAYFNNFLLKNKINNCKFKIEEISNIFKKTKNFKKKYIFKPLTQSASRGVFLEKKIYLIKNNLKKFKKFYLEKKLIIEEYLGDNIYAVDCWIYKKNFLYPILTRKFKNKKIYLSDDRLIFNYQNSKILKMSLLTLRNICDKGELDNLPIHFEFIFKNNKIYPIDFALRGAGSTIYNTLISNALNFSAAKMQILIQLGKKLPKLKISKKVIFLKFISTYYDCLFRGLNQNLINKIRHPYKIKLLKSKNIEIKKLYSSDDRVAIIYFSFNSIKLLKKKFLKLEKFLNQNLIN